MRDVEAESRPLNQRPWTLAAFATLVGWPGYVPLWIANEISFPNGVATLILLSVLGAGPFAGLAVVDGQAGQAHTGSAARGGVVTAGIFWTAYTLAFWWYVATGGGAGGYLGAYIAIAAPLIVGVVMLIGWTSSWLTHRAG